MISVHENTHLATGLPGNGRCYVQLTRKDNDLDRSESTNFGARGNDAGLVNTPPCAGAWVAVQVAINGVAENGFN